MQRKNSKIEQIQQADRTLNSDGFGAWQIAAMESGMAPPEVAAVAAVRLRLLGAAAVASEVLGDLLTADAVTEALRQIHEVANADKRPALYW